MVKFRSSEIWRNTIDVIFFVQMEIFSVKGFRKEKAVKQLPTFAQS